MREMRSSSCVTIRSANAAQPRKIPGDFGFADEYGFDTSKIRIGKSEELVDFEGDAKRQLRDKKRRVPKPEKILGEAGAFHKYIRLIIPRIATDCGVRGIVLILAVKFYIGK